MADAPEGSSATKSATGTGAGAGAGATGAGGATRVATSAGGAPAGSGGGTTPRGSGKGRAAGQGKAGSKGKGKKRINGATVKVFFQPVGDAPLLKRSKFRIGARESFAVVVRFLRRTLQLAESESLVVYCNRTFAPNPSDNVGELLQCFGSATGELVLNYSRTNAWG